ncbi:MAG: FAD-dependent oxidoreductase [Phycisphaeraceae bacterium]|nr:FAD-dependent oxidoreductase [Phycisphaeraceae bacterium]
MKLQNNPTQPQHAIVLGGGLSGIAAAVQLADAGVRVTLVETRKRLGGRATSFVDPVTGQVLDNCQHVLLRCCTCLLNLYRRLGVEEQIQWHRRLYFALGDGGYDVMEADDLPAPAHMTMSLLGMKLLTVREKIAIAKGMWAMLRIGASGRSRWHDRSFAQWLSEHNQPEGAVRKFWAPVAVGALNELPHRMAADYALQVFQEAFCSHEQAYEMGLAKIPLVRLYDAATRVIADAGGTVMLGTSAEQLLFDGRRVAGLRLGDGRVLEADHFVSALPFDRLNKVCDDAMRLRDPRLSQLDRIEVSPIIGIHIWYDAAKQPVMDLPHLILTDSPLHWIFNKGVDRGTGRQHLHGVISAAHDEAKLTAEELLALTASEIGKALPLARGLTPVHGQVVKEKRATFSLVPGIDAMRPVAASPEQGIANLALAGDWCRSGWPATMEGAVRSGYLAAAAAMGEPAALPVSDLTPAPLYRLLTR